MNVLMEVCSCRSLYPTFVLQVRAPILLPTSYYTIFVLQVRVPILLPTSYYPTFVLQVRVPILLPTLYYTTFVLQVRVPILLPTLFLGDLGSGGRARFQPRQYLHPFPLASSYVIGKTVHFQLGKNAVTSGFQTA